MKCPACGEPVALWAAFCPHCGTPLSGADRAEEESLTNELFGESDPAVQDTRPDIPHEPPVVASAPTAALPDPAPSVGDGGVGAAGADGGSAAYQPLPDEPHRGSGAMAFMIAAAIFLAASLGFAVWSILRVDSGEASNSPQASTTSPRPSTGPTSEAPSASPSMSASTPGPSSSAPSPSPSASESPAGPLPDGAIACGVSGEGDTGAVYAANANTSCPFAQEVATVYRASGGASQVTAHSPVTGKDYVVTCSGTLPVTCVADTGATVYLTRG